MIPLWGTILVALASATLSGLFVALIQTRHEHKENLRALMLTAADEFSTGAVEGMTALRQARDAVEKKDAGAAMPQAAQALDVAHSRLARVELLFGDESRAAEAAGLVIVFMRQALGRLTKRPSPDLDAHRREFETAHWCHTVFNRAALQVIRKPKLAQAGTGGGRSPDEVLKKWRAEGLEPPPMKLSDKTISEPAARDER